MKLASLGRNLKLAAIKDPRKDPDSRKDPDPRKDAKDPRLLVPEHFHDFLHVFEKG